MPHRHHLRTNTAVKKAAFVAAQLPSCSGTAQSVHETS
jgi:hypothetical protein